MRRAPSWAAGLPDCLTAPVRVGTRLGHSPQGNSATAILAMAAEAPRRAKALVLLNPANNYSMRTQSPEDSKGKVGVSKMNQEKELNKIRKFLHTACLTSLRMLAGMFNHCCWCWRLVAALLPLMAFLMMTPAICLEASSTPSVPIALARFNK